MPVPVRVMAKSGVAASLLTMRKVVLRGPRPVGRKRTLKVVLPLVCGTAVFVALVLIMKSPASPPVVVMLLIVSGRLPVLLIVKAFSLLSAPRF